MKKKIFVIGLIFALFITGIIFKGVLSTNEKVFALEANKQFVVVIGNGTVETVPDCVKINFGIKLRADSIKEGQEKISQIYDNISTKIKEIDANNTIFVNFSSSYPVCEHGIQSYEINYDISVKSNNLENANQIIEVATENGATSFYNTIYSLENQQNLYNDALIKAKENAIEKANALYSNTNLKELIEISVYSFSQGNKDGKIIVEARVKARFELNNEVENTTNDNTIQEDTTINDANNDILPSENDNNFTEDYNNNDNIIDDNYNNINNEDSNEIIEEQTSQEKDKPFGLSF